MRVDPAFYGEWEMWTGRDLRGPHLARVADILIREPDDVSITNVWQLFNSAIPTKYVVDFVWGYYADGTGGMPGSGAIPWLPWDVSCPPPF